MRVTFFGKGGSGKTTLATAFVKFLENKNKDVIAVDADINVNLATALNMPKKFLGDAFDDLCAALETNTQKPLIGSSPVTRESVFIKGGLDDPFRSLHWLPTDEIAIYTWNNNYAKFKNLNTENSNVADFAGEGAAIQDNFGFYKKDLAPLYTEKWDEIRAILRECPTADEIRAMLVEVGFDLDKFESFYGAKKIHNSTLFGKDLKDRYSVLWIYFELFILYER